MRLILFILTLSFISSAQTQEKHLFILAGQSNMYKLDTKVFFAPIVEEAFGKDNVTMVKSAKRGAPIRAWYKEYKFPENKERPEKSPNGFLYDQLQASLIKATDGKTFDTVTFIWMQGETDAGQELTEVYRDSFNGLINHIKTDLKIDAMNIVIGRLSDYGLDNKDKSDSWKNMRDILVKIAEDAPNGAWVDTDDLNDVTKDGQTKNDLHYSKEGYETLGKRFAEKAIALIKK